MIFQRIAIAIGAALVCGFAPTAWAQNVPETEFTPKNFSIVDERGVDLAQRSLNIGHAISIGDPTKGGMTYSASYSSGGATWKFYQSQMAYARLDHLVDTQTGGTADVWALQYRGSSEAMQWSGTEYVGDLGSRMSLACSGSCVASAILADGTMLTFDTTPIPVSVTGTIFRLTTSVKPSGSRLDYYYVQGGLAIQSITNNYGYQLRFVNPNPSAGGLTPPTAVILLNMAIDACSPTAASCSYTRTWPRLTFEGGGMVTAVTETGGARTVYNYGGASQRIEYIDGPGTRDVSIGYQNCGPLPPNGQCNAGGEWVGGYRVQTVSKGGRTWTYSWDAALAPWPNSEHGVRVTSSAGYVGYRTAITIFGGSGFFEIYPVADRITLVRDELSRNTSFEYIGQLNPRLAKVTYPESNGVQYTYDQRMNVTTIRKFSKPINALPDQYTYIERAESGATTQCGQPALCNKPVRVRDPRGYVTRYIWNATTGQMLSMERGLEGPSSGLTCAIGTDLCPKTNYGYTSLNAYFLNGSAQLVAGAAISSLTSISACENSAACGSSEQVATTIGYGTAGVANNLLVRTSSTGKGGTFRTTSYAYDDVGNRKEVDGSRTDVADVTRFAWDLDRRPTDQVNADGSASRRSYSIEGYLQSLATGTSSGIGQFTPYITTTFEYDGGGNLIKTTTPASVLQKSYDLANRLLCSVRRMNPQAYSSLPTDACVRSASANNVFDRITRNTYDAAGQITLIQRAYDTPLVQNYATYAYTLNGKQDWVQDANGNRSNYSYDAFDRLERLEFPSPTLGANAPNVSDNEQYTYDENDNRKTVKLRSGETITSWYDAINREWYRDVPGGDSNDVYSGYDLFSRLRWARHQSPLNPGVDYAFDAWGDVLTETAYGRTLTYQYDLAGNRTFVIWPDSNYVQYTYDLMNRMDQVRENGATTVPGLLADYSFDVLGRRSTLARGNGSGMIWGYDGASRLSTLNQDLTGTSQDLALGFSYNAANQVLSRTLTNDAYQYSATTANIAYVRDGLNRYTSVGGTTVSYDARGNLSNNGTRAFTYDLDNHLIRVDAAGGSPTLLNLNYDPRGRLRQTIGANAVQFLYSGDQLVAEYNGAGALVRRYVFGIGADEPLVWYEGGAISSATRQWLHANHQGSVIGVSGSAGSLVGTPYSYSAYGEPDTAHGWAGSRFRFTGQIALPEIQLYHYKARIYDPSIGRFLQTDPVFYQDDVNLYSYVGNDPINSIDSSGRQSAPNYTTRPWRVESGPAFGDWTIVTPQPGYRLVWATPPPRGLAVTKATDASNSFRFDTEKIPDNENVKLGIAKAAPISQVKSIDSLGRVLDVDVSLGITDGSEPKQDATPEDEIPTPKREEKKSSKSAPPEDSSSKDEPGELFDDPRKPLPDWLRGPPIDLPPPPELPF